MKVGRRIVMTLAFYPRGGSAQVVRYLGEALEARGNAVTVCCGTLGPQGSSSHAATFFGGLNVEALEFTEAAEWFEQGRDPMAAPVPIHPSFEDRPGVPDRVFASLDDDAYLRQVAVWRSLLERVESPDLYHVHHLTHVNDAVAALGDRPTVVHLHGTELKMLAEIRLSGVERWSHATEWDQRLVSAARRADRLIVISPTDRKLAVDLLGVDPALVEVVPNGVDIDRFTPIGLARSERLAQWRRWLVDEPQGWDESGRPGTIRYSDLEVDRFFLDPATGELLPVLLFVGRFLDFKRVPLLIRAYAAVRKALGRHAPPLVIWGGYPGEWEGEHPHTVATSLGVDGVFFVGWRGHEDLAAGFNCADAFVAPSVDEPFGQVYLEAMGCGLPVIATDSGGPTSFVNTDPTRLNGWRVTPDSEADLADAMVEAASDTFARLERGHQARQLIEREFDWHHIAEHIERIYDDVLA
ncbi:MAG: glycosyltransferase family 4 protein [Actinomycetota bacterium]